MLIAIAHRALHLASAAFDASRRLASRFGLGLFPRYRHTAQFCSLLLKSFQYCGCVAPGRGLMKRTMIIIACVIGQQQSRRQRPQGQSEEWRE
jgi:hypothetical protein